MDMNTAEGFTPGPWYVAEKVDLGRGAEHKMIRTRFDDSGIGVFEVFGATETSPAGANARLIAEAPELFKELERMTRYAEAMERELTKLQGTDFTHTVTCRNARRVMNRARHGG